MSGSAPIWIGIFIAGCGFVLNVILFVKSGAWNMSDRLGTMEGRIMNVITAHQAREAAVADQIRRDFEARMDVHEHNFGETARAMQQKIHEIETWSRDEFVRRSSFEGALNRIEGAMTRIDGKLDQTQSDASKIAASVAALTAAIKAG